MQFTLRDFFWLTIVIGLVIGILIEHADVRALRGIKEKAQWWEEAARYMGKKAAKEGHEPFFDEMKSTGFRLSEDRNLSSESMSFRTSIHSDPDANSITGHIDLDFALLLVAVIAPLSALAGLFLRRTYPAQGKTYAKASLRVHHWTTPIALMMTLGMCVMCFLGRHPYTGTLMLLGVALFVYGIIQNRNLTLTPELEQQIDEKYEQPLNVGNWFKLRK